MFVPRVHSRSGARFVALLAGLYVACSLSLLLLHAWQTWGALNRSELAVQVILLSALVMSVWLFRGLKHQA